MVYITTPETPSCLVAFFSDPYSSFIHLVIFQYETTGDGNLQVSYSLFDCLLSICLSIPGQEITLTSQHPVEMYTEINRKNLHKICEILSKI